MIRKITPGDTGRAAEILVFNNRMNFYPIFGDIEYSFGYMNVLSLAAELGNDESFMSNTYIFEDKVVKGLVYVKDCEVIKLFVDTFFQNEGIGSRLLNYAVTEHGADNLWALEKNTSALRFYERNGFIPDGERKYEEDTTEFLIHLKRK